MKGILVQKDTEIYFSVKILKKYDKVGTGQHFISQNVFIGKKFFEGGFSKDDAIFQMKEKIQSLIN